MGKQVADASYTITTPRFYEIEDVIIPLWRAYKKHSGTDTDPLYFAVYGTEKQKGDIIGMNGKPHGSSADNWYSIILKNSSDGVSRTSSGRITGKTFLVKPGKFLLKKGNPKAFEMAVKYVQRSLGSK